MTTEYVLTFSARRLAVLMEAAGIPIEAGRSGIRLLRFVSIPEDKDIAVEVVRFGSTEWERIEEVQEDSREVETVPQTGQYL